MPGGHRRNLRQAFGWSIREAYIIEKTDERAEYMAQQRDLDEHIRGMSAGIFENRLGGRVCVEGISPFVWCFSLPRSVHVKNVVRWLSGDSLPAYLDSFHRAAVWSRGNAAFVANMSMEEAENVRLCLRTTARRVSAVITCGSRITGRMTLDSAENIGGYAVFVIPGIPITGTALIIQDGGEYCGEHGDVRRM